MTTYAIIEDGSEVGRLTDDPEYSYEYDGDNTLVQRALEDQEDAIDYESDYGPGGATAESHVERSDDRKVVSVLSVIDGREGVSAEERDPVSGAVDALGKLWDRVSGQ